MGIRDSVTHTTRPDLNIRLRAPTQRYKLDTAALHRYLIRSAPMQFAADPPPPPGRLQILQILQISSHE